MGILDFPKRQPVIYRRLTAVIGALLAFEGLWQLFSSNPPIPRIAQLLNEVNFTSFLWISITAAVFVGMIIWACLAYYFPFRAITSTTDLPDRKSLPPLIAVEKFSDPRLRSVRDEATEAMERHDAKIEIVKRQWEQEARKQPRNLPSPMTPIPSEKEVEYRERYHLLVQDKSKFDYAFEVANEFLQLDILKKLFDGKLIAHGFVPPLTPTSQAVQIPSPQWAIGLLKLDFEKGEAEGHGIQYVGIRITQNNR